jgi:hypothetical protein
MMRGVRVNVQFDTGLDSEGGSLTTAKKAPRQRKQSLLSRAIPGTLTRRNCVEAFSHAGQ